jgi:hypothetical protein
MVSFLVSCSAKANVVRLQQLGHMLTPERIPPPVLAGKQCAARAHSSTQINIFCNRSLQESFSWLSRRLFHARANAGPAHWCAGVLSCYGTTSDEDKNDDDGYAAALAADAAALAVEHKEPRR